MTAGNNLVESLIMISSSVGHDLMVITVNLTSAKTGERISLNDTQVLPPPLTGLSTPSNLYKPRGSFLTDLHPIPHT